MKTKPDKKREGSDGPAALKHSLYMDVWGGLPAEEAVVSEKWDFVKPESYPLPSSSHRKPKGSGSRWESKMSNLPDAGQRVPQGRLLTHHEQIAGGQKPCVHLLVLLVRHWLQAESERSPRNHRSLQNQTSPWRRGETPPLASSRSGRARSPSQASYSRLNFKRRTAKINATATSLKLNHTASNEPAALKSVTLNPGRFSRS